MAASSAAAWDALPYEVWTAMVAGIDMLEPYAAHNLLEGFVAVSSQAHAAAYEGAVQIVERLLGTRDRPADLEHLARLRDDHPYDYALRLSGNLARVAKFIRGCPLSSQDLDPDRCTDGADRRRAVCSEAVRVLDRSAAVFYDSLVLSSNRAATSTTGRRIFNCDALLRSTMTQDALLVVTLPHLDTRLHTAAAVLGGRNALERATARADGASNDVSPSAHELLDDWCIRHDPPHHVRLARGCAGPGYHWSTGDDIGERVCNTWRGVRRSVRTRFTVEELLSDALSTRLERVGLPDLDVRFRERALLGGFGEIDIPNVTVMGGDAELAVQHLLQQLSACRTNDELGTWHDVRAGLYNDHNDHNDFPDESEFEDPDYRPGNTDYDALSDGCADEDIDVDEEVSSVELAALIRPYLGRDSLEDYERWGIHEHLRAHPLLQNFASTSGLAGVSVAGRHVSERLARD